MPKQYRYKVKLIQMSNGRTSLAKPNINAAPAIDGEGIYAESGNKVTVGFLNFTRIKRASEFGGTFVCDESGDEYIIKCGTCLGEVKEVKSKPAHHELGYLEKMKQKVENIPPYRGGSSER